MCALFALFARLQQGDSYVYQEETYAKEDKEWEEQDREADMASSCNWVTTRELQQCQDTWSI